MKKITVSLCLALLLLTPGFSKDKKVQFDEQSALNFIKVLASDEMQGRCSGREGGRMASEYIAELFRSWGVEPAGDNGTYFQNFTIEHNYTGSHAYLEIITDSEKREFPYKDDWRIMNYSGAGHFTAEIVFLGYGIHAPDKNYSDYKDIDVKGKIVMISTDTPQNMAGELGEAVFMPARVKAAQEMGAAGIIGCNLNTRESQFVFVHVTKELYKPDFVVLGVESAVTSYIFRDLKTEPRYLQAELAKKNSVSFATGVSAVVSIDSEFDPQRPTRNVLAKITGQDKKLRDEVIVIGAHMDHMGILPPGLVYNGADDNASGTAVVMELARVMKANNFRPKRTIVFALWAGEEQGLLGSTYYVKHPVFPIEKTVLNLNMDMVGHGDGPISFRGTYYGPQIWTLLEGNLPKDILDSVITGRGGPGGSDHSPFLNAGVPGYMIQSKGHHFKYHTSRDDTDLINPAALKGMGDFMMAAVDITANTKENLLSPMRLENYLLKYELIPNFRLVPFSTVIDKLGNKENPTVDIQMTLIDPLEGLSGSDLKINLVGRMIEFENELKNAPGLTSYSSPFNSYMFSREAKVLALPGIKGISVFQDYPQWAEVLAKMGVKYAIADDMGFLFNSEGLTGEGKNFIKIITDSGLLIFASGLDDKQIAAVLENSAKPMVFLRKDLPDEELLKKIRMKGSAIGLIFGEKDDPAVYFQKIAQAIEAAGDTSVMIINEECLWGEAGQKHLLDVISQMVKAGYNQSDLMSSSKLSGILSGNLFRLLNMVQKAAPAGQVMRMHF